MPGADEGQECVTTDSAGSVRRAQEDPHEKTVPWNVSLLSLGLRRHAALAPTAALDC
jgi:hypothetical protein